MALIKCSECNKEVSTLAESCPHCGAPIQKELLEERKEKELIKVEVTKEKCSIITIILAFLVSFSMLIAFFIYDIKDYYLIASRSTEYDLSNCLVNEKIGIYAWIFGGSIGLITFFSFLLKIFSRKTNLIAKIGYIINLLIMSIFFIGVQSNDLRVGFQFWLIYIINIVLFLIPRLDKVITQNTLVPKKDKNHIERKNEKLEKIYSKKRLNKVNVIIYSLIFIIVGVGTLVMFNINNKSYETYEQKNPHGLNQLKVKNDFINVREKPTLNSDIVGKIYEGDIYNIIDTIDEHDESYIWYKIEYKDEYAYIASERKKPYIKIIYKNKVPTGYGIPNSEVERKLQPVLSTRKYIHSDSEQYSLYENDQNSRTTLYLYSNIFERFINNNKEQLLIKYNYLNGKVDISYLGEDYNSIDLVYDLESEEYLCNSLYNDINYCSNAIAYSKKHVPILIKEFETYLTEAKITLADFNK